MFAIVLLGVSLLLIQVPLCLGGLVGTLVALSKRRWGIAAALLIPTLIFAPATFFVFASAQVYRFPQYTAPVQIEGRYAGVEQAVTFTSDGRYVFDEGGAGSWTLVRNEEEGLSPHAGTLTLSPDQGEGLEMGVRWDQAVGYQGELLWLK
ncbi:MAG: hypothetical protein ACI9VR_003718 [Cognaticolwellia sp.]|jgi:hypothetical protein